MRPFAFLLLGFGIAGQLNAAPIDFNRQVLPILAEHCYACHGPDSKTRKADLRLDTPEGLKAANKDGELVKRITSASTDELMPPRKFNKPLKSEQIKAVTQWVAEGAKWERHWSLVAPKRSAPPAVRNAAWTRNAIDQFILARLEQENLSPESDADRARMLRRVTLDLTGLPPTPAEVDSFMADRSATAYEAAVDRLLKSERYGEHMARYWLDAARYGDTHGLHLDNYREMWPFRDWVIRAFNENKPYDRFIAEQIAGDLMPSPTTDQLVATGFLRAHVTTSEGGSIDEEIYVRNVADRVDTFGTVILGQSFTCAKCHDHKYDPYSQKDYYSIFAFFNSLEGSPLDGNAALHPPFVRVPTPDISRELASKKAALTKVENEIADRIAKTELKDSGPTPKAKPAQRGDYVWIEDSLPAGVQQIADGGTNLAWSFVSKKDGPVHTGERSVKLTAKGLQQSVVEKAIPALKVGKGDVFFAYVYLDPNNPPEEIMMQWHTSAWLHRAYWGANKIDWGRDKSPERKSVGKLPETGKWVRIEVKASDVGIQPGVDVSGFAVTQYGGTCYWDHIGLTTETAQGATRFDSIADWATARGTDPSLPAPLRDALKLDPAKRSADQNKLIRNYFIENVYSATRDQFAVLQQERAAITAEVAAIEAKQPATLIFKDTPTPRPSFVLKRGEYDQRQEQVGRKLPAALPQVPLSKIPNRIDLANWLFTAEHPLTSRVAVNRFWQQFFGTGLAKTVDDLGTQGEPPSHPELLDYLAVEFRESGWDVKKLVKSIVLSSTYRQSAKVTPEKLAKDPANRRLSRGPRFRLDAEMVRDQALFISGLLVERVGGPSVKPPQPSGLWEAVGYTGSNTAIFRPDKGDEKVHRRSVYTFWKRTAPPPQMSALDAPSREACTVRRERTNTPLQALLLLNETQFVEAARGMAERAMVQSAAPKDRLSFLFKAAVSRPPDADELNVLLAAYSDHLATYRTNPAAATKLLSVGDARPTKLDPIEWAATTMVANSVMNLDEMLTK